MAPSTRDIPSDATASAAGRLLAHTRTLHPCDPVVCGIVAVAVVVSRLVRDGGVVAGSGTAEGWVVGGVLGILGIEATTMIGALAAPLTIALASGVAIALWRPRVHDIVRSGFVATVSAVVTAMVLVGVGVILTAQPSTLFAGVPADAMSGAWRGHAVEAALFEEVLFRLVLIGVPLRLIRVGPAAVRTALALLISSVLFALAHDDGSAAVWYFAAGGALGLVYLRVGLAGAVIAHAAYNAAAVVMAPT